MYHACWKITGLILLLKIEVSHQGVLPNFMPLRNKQNKLQSTEDLDNVLPHDCIEVCDDVGCLLVCSEPSRGVKRCAVKETLKRKFCCSTEGELSPIINIPPKNVAPFPGKGAEGTSFQPPLPALPQLPELTTKFKISPRPLQQPIPKAFVPGSILNKLRSFQQNLFSKKVNNCQNTDSNVKENASNVSPEINSLDDISKLNPEVQNVVPSAVSESDHHGTKAQSLFQSMAPSIFTSEISDQNTMNPFEIPDQNTLNPFEISDQSTINSFEIPDQNTMYPFEIPDQSTVNPSRIPYQNTTNASEISEDNISLIPNEKNNYPAFPEMQVDSNLQDRMRTVYSDGKVANFDPGINLDDSMPSILNIPTESHLSYSFPKVGEFQDGDFKLDQYTVSPAPVQNYNFVVEDVFPNRGRVPILQINDHTEMSGKQGETNFDRELQYQQSKNEQEYSLKQTNDRNHAIPGDNVLNDLDGVNNCLPTLEMNNEPDLNLDQLNDYANHPSEEPVEENIFHPFPMPGEHSLEASLPIHDENKILTTENTFAFADVDIKPVDVVQLKISKDENGPQFSENPKNHLPYQEENRQRLEKSFGKNVEEFDYFPRLESGTKYQHTNTFLDPYNENEHIPVHVVYDDLEETKNKNDSNLRAKTEKVLSSSTENIQPDALKHCSTNNELLVRPDIDVNTNESNTIVVNDFTNKSLPLSIKNLKEQNEDVFTKSLQSTNDTKIFSTAWSETHSATDIKNKENTIVKSGENSNESNGNIQVESIDPSSNDMADETFESSDLHANTNESSTHYLNPFSAELPLQLNLKLNALNENEPLPLIKDNCTFSDAKPLPDSVQDLNLQDGDDNIDTSGINTNDSNKSIKLHEYRFNSLQPFQINNDDFTDFKKPLQDSFANFSPESNEEIAKNSFINSSKDELNLNIANNFVSQIMTQRIPKIYDINENEFSNTVKNLKDKYTIVETSPLPHSSTILCQEKNDDHILKYKVNNSAKNDQLEDFPHSDAIADSVVISKTRKNAFINTFETTNEMEHKEDSNNQQKLTNQEEPAIENIQSMALYPDALGQSNSKNSEKMPENSVEMYFHDIIPDRNKLLVPLSQTLHRGSTVNIASKTIDKPIEDHISEINQFKNIKRGAENALTTEVPSAMISSETLTTNDENYLKPNITDHLEVYSTHMDKSSLKLVLETTTESFPYLQKYSPTLMISEPDSTYNYDKSKVEADNLTSVNTHIINSTKGDNYEQLSPSRIKLIHAERRDDSIYEDEVDRNSDYSSNLELKKKNSSQIMVTNKKFNTNDPDEDNKTNYAQNLQVKESRDEDIFNNHSFPSVKSIKQLDENNMGTKNSEKDVFSSDSINYNTVSNNNYENEGYDNTNDATKLLEEKSLIGDTFPRTTSIEPMFENNMNTKNFEKYNFDSGINNNNYGPNEDYGITNDSAKDEYRREEEILNKDTPPEIKTDEPTGEISFDTANSNSETISKYNIDSKTMNDYAVTDINGPSIDYNNTSDSYKILKKISREEKIPNKDTFPTVKSIEPMPGNNMNTEKYNFDSESMKNYKVFNTNDPSEDNDNTNDTTKLLGKDSREEEILNKDFFPKVKIIEQRNEKNMNSEHSEKYYSDSESIDNYREPSTNGPNDNYDNIIYEGYDIPNNNTSKLAEKESREEETSSSIIEPLIENTEKYYFDSESMNNYTLSRINDSKDYDNINAATTLVEEGIIEEESLDRDTSLRVKSIEPIGNTENDGKRNFTLETATAFYEDRTPIGRSYSELKTDLITETYFNSKERKYNRKHDKHEGIQSITIVPTDSDPLSELYDIENKNQITPNVIYNLKFNTTTSKSDNKSIESYQETNINDLLEENSEVQGNGSEKNSQIENYLVLDQPEIYKVHQDENVLLSNETNDQKIKSISLTSDLSETREKNNYSLKQEVHNPLDDLIYNDLAKSIMNDRNNKIRQSELDIQGTSTTTDSRNDVYTIDKDSYGTSPISYITQVLDIASERPFQSETTFGDLDIYRVQKSQIQTELPLLGNTRDDISKQSEYTIEDMSHSMAENLNTLGPGENGNNMKQSEHQNNSILKKIPNSEIKDILTVNKNVKTEKILEPSHSNKKVQNLDSNDQFINKIARPNSATKGIVNTLITDNLTELYRSKNLQEQMKISGNNNFHNQVIEKNSLAERYKTSNTESEQNKDKESHSSSRDELHKLDSTTQIRNQISTLTLMFESSTTSSTQFSSPSINEPREISYHGYNGETKQSGESKYDTSRNLTGTENIKSGDNKLFAEHTENPLRPNQSDSKKTKSNGPVKIDILTSAIAKHDDHDERSASHINWLTELDENNAKQGRKEIGDVTNNLGHQVSDSEINSLGFHGTEMKTTSVSEILTSYINSNKFNIGDLYIQGSTTEPSKQSTESIFNNKYSSTSEEEVKFLNEPLDIKYTKQEVTESNGNLDILGRNEDDMTDPKQNSTESETYYLGNEYFKLNKTINTGIESKTKAPETESYDSTDKDLGLPHKSYSRQYTDLILKPEDNPKKRLGVPSEPVRANNIELESNEERSNQNIEKASTSFNKKNPNYLTTDLVTIKEVREYTESTTSKNDESRSYETDTHTENIKNATKDTINDKEKTCSCNSELSKENKMSERKGTKSNRRSPIYIFLGEDKAHNIPNNLRVPLLHESMESPMTRQISVRHVKRHKPSFRQEFVDGQYVKVWTTDDANDHIDQNKFTNDNVSGEENNDETLRVEHDLDKQDTLTKNTPNKELPEVTPQADFSGKAEFEKSKTVDPNHSFENRDVYSNGEKIYKDVIDLLNSEDVFGEPEKGDEPGEEIVAGPSPTIDPSLGWPSFAEILQGVELAGQPHHHRKHQRHRHRWWAHARHHLEKTKTKVKLKPKPPKHERRTDHFVFSKQMIDDRKVPILVISERKKPAPEPQKDSTQDQSPELYVPRKVRHGY